MNIPPHILESVRLRVQSRYARKKRQVPVVVVDENSRPHLETINGKTTAVVGKDFLCGDYYN